MPPITKNQLGAMIIDRVFKGFLFLIGAPAFCFCLWLVVGAYVKLKDDPPWAKIVMASIDLVVYLVGPVSMFAATMHWHRSFIRNFSDRLGRIEDEIDPLRASSGLRRDGSDPPLGPTS